MEFINNLINAKFDFAAIGVWFSELYASVTAHDGIASLISTAEGYINMVPAAAVAGILLVLSLIMAFFGKKLLGFMKFVTCFGVGYALGVYYLTAPIQGAFASIPSWVIGLVVGAVAALLCVLIYFLAYVVGFGYSVYLVLMGGYYLPETITSFTKGNWIVSLAAAAVVIVIALLLRKWIEMLGTAALGGYLAYLSIDSLLVATVGHGVAGFDFLAPYELYVKLGVLALIGLVGFIVQVKTRRRW